MPTGHFSHVFYIVLLLLSASTSASTHGVALPWLQEGPRAARQPWTGLHNDLPALLKEQAYEDKWITLFVYSGPLTRFALNTIYSYIVHGQGTKYVVAVTDEGSLNSCL